MEDTKGNNGEQGELLVTNLRIMWISKKSRKTNITIGFNCVISLSIKVANSRLKGPARLQAWTRGRSRPTRARPVPPLPSNPSPRPHTTQATRRPCTC